MSSVRSLLCLSLVVALSVIPVERSSASPADTAWVRQLPGVTSIRTRPEQPSSSSFTGLSFEGVFGGECGSILEARTIDPHHVELHILNGIRGCSDSTDSPVVWGVELGLGVLPAGIHHVDIDYSLMDDISPPPVYHTVFSFLVQGEPPPPGPLPFVRDIHIGPPPTPNPEPRLCPNDSILVVAYGVFPNACYSVRRIDLLPSPIVGPLPEPPIVRFLIDDHGCEDQICSPVLTPWEARVMLPPLPTRDYRLIAEVAHVTCSDSISPDSVVHSAAFPFRVDSCAAHPCLLGGWLHAKGEKCDATVSPRHPDSVVFSVRTRVPLAGLQGSFERVMFRGQPPEALPLVIKRIVPVGAARGMHLTWRPTEFGARFTLFADHGSPIAPPDSAGGDSLLRGEVPILKVTVALAGDRAQGIGVLVARNLLGTDADGHEIPECTFGPLVPDAAHICLERGCDFNADGRTDVRDLVLMAHCVLAPVDTNGASTCPDSSRNFDCNADSVKDLRDVLCCARSTLRDHDCPGCPADTTHDQPGGDVRAALGSPIYTESGVDIPLDLGSGPFGGSILEIAFPGDRYEATYRFGDVPAWLMLSDVQSEYATLGIVNLSGLVAVPLNLPPSIRAEPLSLSLTLRPGKTHGGQVVIRSAEFSSFDGAKLDVTPSTIPVNLGGRPSLALSESRPNPFDGETTFQLTLDRPGDATVSIFDLGGRRVATLHHGALSAGSHPFTWRGARDDGTAVGSGVYFYRATTGQRSVSKRLVFLGR